MAHLIAIDLAKNVFQLHGVDDRGTALFRKKLRREQVVPFFTTIEPTRIAMEAWATAHYWARELSGLGDTVKLIAPQYVKPFVKRQKNDMADAEAIAEAAQRPSMRFVEPKSIEKQSRAALFRTRDLLVRQRTQLVNSLRGTLAEFGAISAKGIPQLSRLKSALEEADSHGLPEGVAELGKMYLGKIEDVSKEIDTLTLKIKAEGTSRPELRRLQTMPGVGPIIALAIDSFVPDMKSFRRGRDFSAWLGLVPKQHSSGGKDRLGKTSKMGQRDIRRLLISGAMAVLQWTQRSKKNIDPWLARMLEKKPRLMVAVALANRMARGLWAMTVKNEEFRPSHKKAIA